MKKEWFATKELVGVAGLPTTVQGISQRAKRESWQYRKRVGVQGKAVEYHIESIPEKVQLALRLQEEGAKYSAQVNEPLTIWMSAYNQLTQKEREQLISLLLRHGVAGLMAKVNGSSDDSEESSD
ncbi:DNA-binding protein [Pragia fontium]|uniref:Mu DNA-binding domain-containing protein n=2 Tax=Pragia fontium TaxID=82985 RepID=A0AAJ4W8M7_9GAMM|nr:DNA-binding protein [Pragia fontium]AKJ41061.1 DNA-binding protein [Pragia fontium]SFC16853.1 Mu DNA-binding domain-containing protein [Pragia fontium DSM 5563 = ATCC 49100]SUB81254.1 Mu DNA-binding domain [Pragia fontium]VEJ53368.1 Mu DNA-binding domain [Pragia fontium]GKX63229.1 hypothetical protein SOASR032_17980 [Pragia fontium]